MAGERATGVLRRTRTGPARPWTGHHRDQGAGLEGTPMGDVGVLQNRPAVSLGQWLQRADSVPRLGVIAFALGTWGTMIG